MLEQSVWTSRGHALLLTVCTLVLLQHARFVVGGIHGPSRHPSITPSKADDIPKSVVRQNSTASSAAASADGFVPAMHEDDMPDVSHFETSHDIESATAHEKHAYLHSQHGLEDVFECC